MLKIGRQPGMGVVMCHDDNGFFPDIVFNMPPEKLFRYLADMLTIWDHAECTPESKHFIASWNEATKTFHAERVARMEREKHATNSG